MFLHQWDLWRRITKAAELAKLDQQSPYREQLVSGRMNILVPAKISAVMNEIQVGPEDVARYYCFGSAGNGESVLPLR